CAQGQARHLHVPERRPVTARPVRLQAAARQSAGHRPARLDPERPAADADDLCFIKSMHTEQINHDPAVTFAQTGFQLSGRPSLGAWVSYGLGTINQDLPAFVVMITGNGQALAERQWG